MQTPILPGQDLDDGFYSAVNSLIQQTKRPIVLTSSDPAFAIAKTKSAIATVITTITDIIIIIITMTVMASLPHHIPQVEM